MNSRYASALAALLVLPVLAGCTDQRATYPIQGSASGLTLIRVTGLPWEKTAKYDIVAARMPDCMRRHAMGKAGLSTSVEVYAPGNGAWILKQGKRMFVVETRTCEGFAPLDKVPEQGLGVLMGSFEMRDDTLVFTPVPGAVVPVPAAAAEPTEGEPPGN